MDYKCCVQESTIQRAYTKLNPEMYIPCFLQYPPITELHSHLKFHTSTIPKQGLMSGFGTDLLILSLPARVLGCSHVAPHQVCAVLETNWVLSTLGKHYTNYAACHVQSLMTHIKQEASGVPTAQNRGKTTQKIHF